MKMREIQSELKIINKYSKQTDSFNFRVFILYYAQCMINYTKTLVLIKTFTRYLIGSIKKILLEKSDFTRDMSVLWRC